MKTLNTNRSNGIFVACKTLLIAIIICCLGIGVQYELCGINNRNSNIEVYKTQLADTEIGFPLSLEKERVDSENYTLHYKLFNLFTVKKVNAKVVGANSVYLGGMSIGINFGQDGAVISAILPVISDNGKFSPAEDAGLTIGDNILTMDKKAVTNIYDLSQAVRSCGGKKIIVTFLRNGKTMTTEMTPVIDSLTKNYMVGIYINESVSGIGTVTFIKPDTKRYGALGHPASVIKQDENVSGKAYTTKIHGAIKGKKGKAGEILGQINQNERIGNVEINSKYGIFGHLSEMDTNGMTKVDVGGRNSAKIGKAIIYTTINEQGVKPYEIEIVKTEYQPEQKEKGLVIRVTDTALIEATGGIIQGMSGSPIIQDGRLVGAVSHVFINDPTRGYGMYIDWMINK